MINNLVQAVKAAKVFAAKNDIRFYFNGVALYVSDDGVIESVVATDGYSMAVIGSTELNGEASIIANKDIDTLCNALATSDQVKVNWPVIEIGDYKIQLVDGRYPNVKRVIPTGERKPADVIGIQPDILAKLKPFKAALTKNLKPRDRAGVGCKMMCGTASEAVMFKFDNEKINNEKINNAIVVVNPMRL